MTVNQYSEARAQLEKSGWRLVVGMFPNSNAEPDTLVTWVAHFEKSNGPGKRPDSFSLTANTFTNLPK